MNNNLNELASVYKNKGSSPYLRKNIKNIIDHQDNIPDNIPDNIKESINIDMKYLKKTNEQIKHYSKLSKEINKELKNKEKLIASRERMLQVKQDKNIYKEKLMYSYITIVIPLIIFLLVSYNYFK